MSLACLLPNGTTPLLYDLQTGADDDAAAAALQPDNAVPDSAEGTTIRSALHRTITSTTVLDAFCILRTHTTILIYLDAWAAVSVFLIHGWQGFTTIGRGCRRIRNLNFLLSSTMV